jgi:ornithine carbamoyltransferase
MEAAFKDADIVYPKSWASFSAMEERTKLYEKNDWDGIKTLEKRLLAQNAEHKNWECDERLMATTKNGQGLYLHCLPADITGVSCQQGEVASGVFDKFRVPLYRQASYKPYVIAAMMLLAKKKNPALTLEKLLEEERPRVR